MQAKKVFLTLIIGIVVSLIMIPGVAQAAQSPTLVTEGPVYNTASTGEQVGFWVQYTGQPGWIIVEPSDKTSENFASGKNPFVSFRAYESEPGAVVDSQGRIPGGLLLNFELGEKYAGYTAKIYIEHDYGDNEVKTVTVSAKGLASTNIDRLSNFSIDLEEPSGDVAKKQNTSTSSPDTGTDMVPVAITLSVLCAGGAAVCLARARKER